MPATMAPRRYTLAITGGRPVAFTGEPVLTDETKDPKKPDRWHTVTIYNNVAAPLWIAHVEYHSIRPYEDHRIVQAVVTADDPGTLGDRLAAYIDHPETLDGCLLGFPAGGQYADRRKAVVQQLTARFRDLITRVMARLPGTERPL